MPNPAGPTLAKSIFRKKKKGWGLNLHVVEMYFIAMHALQYIFLTASFNFHVENLDGSSASASSVLPIEICLAFLSGSHALLSHVSEKSQPKWAK